MNPLIPIGGLAVALTVIFALLATADLIRVEVSLWPFDDDDDDQAWQG